MKNIFTIKSTKKFGRGLYANRNIKKGEIVEISPVLAIEKKEANSICDTLLNIYVFAWNSNDSALALGYGSLFNHSKKPNVTYMNNFQSKEMIFMASKNIKKGQQLFINYGYEPEHGLAVTKRNKENKYDRLEGSRNLRASTFDGIAATHQTMDTEMGAWKEFSNSEEKNHKLNQAIDEVENELKKYKERASEMKGEA